MHRSRGPAVLSATALMSGMVALLGFNTAAAGIDQEKRSGAGMDRSGVNKVLAGWTPGPRLAGAEMMAKYGAPQEVTSDRIIWQNAGPYKRIMLTREELPHDFPITHLDYLEHTIAYNVPPDKTDEVHAFDASITIYRVAGELSARCDLESNNVLTLNLANDIVTGKKNVDDARKEFGEAVSDRTLGKPPANTMALQFQPAKGMASADREKVTIAGSSQRATGAAAPSGPVGTSGTSAPIKANNDAEIMALLIALDENEVHAAMTAQEKKVTGPILAYAKTLHQDHGKSIHDTQKLGMKINVTPTETAAVDQLHNKGAQQLAKIVPMSGADFGKAYVSTMAAGHREALQMVDQWQKAAQNDGLKQHLTTARQHLEMHLKEAEKLGGR